MNKKLVAENLHQFMSESVNEDFKGSIKRGVERVKSFTGAVIKKVGQFYDALFNGEKLTVGLPINLAVSFKNKELEKSVYVIPDQTDVKKEPSLSKFTSERYIERKKELERRMHDMRNKKFTDVEEYANALRRGVVNESYSIKEGIEAFKHFDKNVMNVNSARLQREIYKKMSDPSSTPLMIWGAPGIGKTEIVNQVLSSKKRKGRLILFDAQFMTPEAWFMPYISREGDEPKYVDLPKGALPLYKVTDDPEKNKVADDAANDGEGGIIFFDELSRASIEVQGSCLTLMAQRQLGEFRLGSKWVIIAASNRKTDEADPGAIKFSSTLGNRFLQVNYIPEFKEWRTWAKDHNVNSAILHFLDFNYEKYWYTKSDDDDQSIFASPRSWKHASDSLALEEKTCDDLGVECTKIDKFGAMAGAVGVDVAEAIISFMYITDKYPMSQIQNIWSKPAAGPKFERKGKSGTGIDMTEAIAVCVVAVDLKKNVKSLPTEDFNNFARWLVSIDHPSAAVYAFKMLLDQHPYMHEDLGDFREDKVKYKEGTDMLLAHYGKMWGGE